MPGNEIVLPDGKILFILPENESLDTVFENKLAAAQPGGTGSKSTGREFLHLSLAGNKLNQHIKSFCGFQLIFDAESRKVVLEGERLVSQTQMGEVVVGREIMNRVEVPFHFLQRMELYAIDLPAGETASFGVSPISVWIDDGCVCSKIVNAAYEFVVSPIPQFRFFFPQAGKSLAETVYFNGKPNSVRLFQAVAAVADRLCSREFNVVEI